MEGKVAAKYLDTLIEGGYIKNSNSKLELTNKGNESYLNLKKVERFTHTKHLHKGTSKKVYTVISSIICIALITLLIIFGPIIIENLNSWLASI
ncbi:MAG: winged helix-turn-helix domain-containing protein [Candidatus Lokiarchaeota archaeon]